MVSLSNDVNSDNLGTKQRLVQAMSDARERAEIASLIVDLVSDRHDQLLHLIAESRAQREQAEQPTLERSLARFRDLTATPERRRLVAIYLGRCVTDD